MRYGPSAGYVVGLPVTSIDGWRVDEDFGDRRHLTAFVGKTKETNAGGPLLLDNADTDTDLFGVELCCARTRPADLSFRLYQQKTNTGLLIGNARLYIFDFKARGAAGRLRYQAELAKNLGESAKTYAGEFRTAAGLGVLADAAYDAGPWTFSAQFGWGSGDNGYDPKKDKAFQSVSSDYRPGLIWGGLSAIGAAGGAASLAGYNTPGLSGDGVSGLETANVGLSYRPAAWEKLTVDFHAFWFSRSRSETLVPFSHPFNPSPEPITSRTLGDELDLSAVWKHSESISLAFAYGMFLPGSGLKDILTRSLPGEANAPAGTPFFLGSAKVQLASASVNVKF